MNRAKDRKKKEREEATLSITSLQAWNIKMILVYYNQHKRSARRVRKEDCGYCYHWEGHPMKMIRVVVVVTMMMMTVVVALRLRQLVDSLSHLVHQVGKHSLKVSVELITF